ncbi:MAG: hypothetical protein AD742_17675 [Methylibium sp. NZG]|nr:MAG: hypothetical protein AD742_17675 [Methylibium sp. NZG]
MATSPPPPGGERASGAQRAYRAACPNCGAPVDFASAASAFAVCGFCRSTIVREGDALRKIGESAELFDDHSPLQLGVAGKSQGSAFTLVGRLQYRYQDGTWNEWHALFDTGPDSQKSGWLSEDNGRYVLSFSAPLDGPAPPPESLRPGAQQLVNSQAWSVSSVAVAKLIAAQGELPDPPNLERGFVVADLRNTRDEVGTLDYSDPARPRWSVGRSVALSELALTGLADVAEKTLSARGVACPSCGTALALKLASTQSIVCHQCRAVVDVSQGVGADLRHYQQQSNFEEPQIALGSVGTLALGGQRGSKVALTWQVVGYAERSEVPESADDEQEFWREYLLYHRSEGFAFLVDANDGWSWTAPITGVPQGAGDTVRYRGAPFRKLYSYTGRVVYVLGEFYWRLERDQTTFNTDYIGSGGLTNTRLNREKTGDGDAAEVVWSAGETLSADAVAEAFKLAPGKSAALQRDALPTVSQPTSLLFKVVVILLIFIVLLAVVRCDDRDDCDTLRATFGDASQEYRNCLAANRSRTSGGSYGGFSTGGGHK